MLPRSARDGAGNAMHEIGIVRQILRTAEQVAAKNGIDAISGITVECGELSMVVPDYLRDIFPVVTRDTILDGAELEIDIVPGMAICNKCDEIFNVVENEGYCPECHSFDKDILSGRDFKVRQIYVPDIG